MIQKPMHKDAKIRLISWLREKVFPLWSSEGFDSRLGLFAENLTFDGKSQTTTFRALVQARQIYSFAEGARLNVIDKNLAERLVARSGRSLIEKFQKPDGSILHSIDQSGARSADCDLYTQAFAIFAFAQAYGMTGDNHFKKAASNVLLYLIKERLHSNGGFTEIKNNKVFFQSNPHMHLFESLLAWVKIDSDPTWSHWAKELFKLCREKFIDSQSGFLAEHFDSDWQPIKVDGKFICEPGHHFEWCWLFFLYEEGQDTKFNDPISKKLFVLAEEFGLSGTGNLALDEIWSDGSTKKLSSRFWPQCEWVKASVRLGEINSADKALNSLMNYYLDLENGLWLDTRLENGDFKDQFVKASSLYHIINAISEYEQFR